jgi:NAD(P) transhydrogenase subunit beta
MFCKFIRAMDCSFYMLIDFAVIILLLVAVRCFRTPKGAVRGNFIAALTLVCAFALVLYRNKIFDLEIVAFSLVVGLVIGGTAAMRVNMVHIPAMIAFQNGAGGFAAFVVSFIELTKVPLHTPAVHKAAGVLALIVGMSTFSGSVIASGKLADKLKPTPTFLPRHNWLLLGNGLLIIMLCVVTIHSAGRVAIYLLIALAALFATVFSIRIGGADMPVLISFLNAASGLAGALCGIAIQNSLLIGCGATVAASGFILTHAMCKAMNRNLLAVFIGTQPKPSCAPDKGIDYELQQASPTEVPASTKELDRENVFARAVNAARKSRQVVIVPGYGMAISQAQFKVRELANRLEQMGKKVEFAIHPVAGRMPGHMNVLLAEAGIEYDKLVEMNDINLQLEKTDLVFVVGACDVVNPAAIEKEGTPISGMPIVMAHRAKTVVVCNIDKEPGYSGVENPLYENNKTIVLLGDAKRTIEQLLEGLKDTPEVLGA